MYWRYYPHRLRDALSPICGIFKYLYQRENLVRVNPKFSLSGKKNHCAGTYSLFFASTYFSKGTVSLEEADGLSLVCQKRSSFLQE